jgi:hypothetical protein
MKTQNQNTVKPETQSCQMAVSGSVTPSELSSITMMVSNDGKIWKRRNVIALHNGSYVTSEGIRTCMHTDEDFTSINYWRFAKII